MTPDTNIKSYYLQYISNADKSIKEYQQKIADLQDNKIATRQYLEEHKEEIYNSFNIDLDTKQEWIENKHIDKTLYDLSIKLLRYNQEDLLRELLVMLNKYCVILYSEFKYNRLISLAYKRKNLTLAEYKKFVAIYYNKVHESVLNGHGYRFAHGLGTFIINYWELDPNKVRGEYKIDFDATNKRKKELIEKGCKLYDDVEATWYKERGIPYDGVEYRIYKHEDHFYDITFICSRIFKSNRAFKFQRTEYINSKYRGLSYKEIADTYCKSIEDIVNLQVDIRYKLNILLYLFPNKYLQFVRNETRHKYEY